MEDKLGIELLKDFTTDVVAVIEKIAEAREDGEITKAEVIGMLPKIGAVAKDLFKYKELIAEAKDVNSAEGKQLVSHISELGIIGDKAEVVAINVVEIIEAEIEVWKNNIVPIIEVLKK
jgi:Mg2+ and Co2+ transporter CorA